MEVFASLSLAAACTVTAALALGEGWTDPALIGWAIFVEATLLFTFCVVTNGLAGFIARRNRRRGWRTVEAATVGGPVAVQLAVAFHEEIWELLAGGPDVPLACLVAMTCGAALLGVGAGSAMWHGAPTTDRKPSVLSRPVGD